MVMKKIIGTIAVIICLASCGTNSEWKHTVSGLTNDGTLIDTWEKTDCDTLFTKTIRRNFNSYEGKTLDGSEIHTEVETFTKEYDGVIIREFKVTTFVCGSKDISVTRDTTYTCNTVRSSK